MNSKETMSTNRSRGLLLIALLLALAACIGSKCALFGDAIFGVPERNTIRDNTTVENSAVGIDMAAFDPAFRPFDNLIQSNTAFGNGNVDLREGIPEGGPFGDCLNTWVDNDFDVAAPDCIQ